MLFSRDWLAEYVEVPPGADGAAELAARLTAAGLTVETLEAQGDDWALDVDVTTNRTDCMNHLGLARETAVVFDRPLRLPGALAGETIAESATPVGDAVRLTVEDPTGCPRYVARVVRGVEVGPSPDWLARRLTAIGQRPINNVVDVTNFVLWETGQPLHAFDLATLGGDPLPEIRVRRARAGEELTTLDGEKRTLTADMLVIADAGRAVALAGVMGGEATEVTAATTAILLESAHFEPRAVRAAAAGLGLHTDASHRFERGADPEACRAAADRASALIAEVAGGEVLAGALDARAPLPLAARWHDAGRWPPRGRLRLTALNRFTGAAIPAVDVERWLGGLGFAPVAVTDGAGSGDAGPVWDVTVPSWRWYDVQSGPAGEVYPADLFEEMIRLYGFDRVPATLPAIGGSDGPRTPAQIRRDRIRRELAGYGYAEAIHFAFQSRAADGAAPALVGGEPLALVNPLSERHGVLRRSLVPNLVEGARFNRRRGAEAVRLFEVGHVFAALPAGERGADGLPVEERETVALICGGAVGTPWERRVELDLFDLKGAVEGLGEALGTPLVARPAELPGVVPGTGAYLTAGGGEAAVRAGWLGRIDDPGADAADLPLYAAEIATAELGEGAAEHDHPVTPPSRFPGVAADFTLTHPLATPWADLAAAVEAHRPPELVDFGLKVRYQGEGVPAGAVNTTLYFVYNSPERSLTQEEVNLRQRALAAELERRFAVRPAGGAGGTGGDRSVER